MVYSPIPICHIKNKKTYFMINPVKRTLLSALLLVGVLIHAQKISLYHQFVNPPKEARPHLWWHWMNGNITKEGIRKDLMWMNSIGIGGLHLFDAGLETPQIVEKRLQYMSPEWKDAFAYAIRLTDSLGMETAVASSPGWSSTGGPWVKPEDAMKKLTWREMILKGGKRFEGTLPQPYTETGYYQNFNTSAHALFVSGNEVTYYKDICVIAVKLPQEDKNMLEMGAKATSSNGDISLTPLTDGDMTTGISLPRDDKNGYAWIQYEFKQPQTIKALSVVDENFRNEWASVPADVSKHLEAGDDGRIFRRVCDIPHGGAARQTIAVPATTARFFRVVFDNPTAKSPTLPPSAATHVAELELYPVCKINHAEEKAGFATPPDLEKYPTPHDTSVARYADVMDLTDKTDAHGRLTWDVPAGKWKIYRFGYSLTGKKNHPASPEATGLEVDKLDAKAVNDYLEYYLSTYKDASGGMMGSRGLQSLLIDSYESGWQTWTPLMAQEFERRRGYSLLKWMPVLTGQIIESADKSEKFLWDWRKTIGELITENLYENTDRILARHGMSTYFETHENGRLYLADGMAAKSRGDFPMAAMWCQPTDAATTPMSESDIKESASVAHLYGKRIVAAESMTANGLYSGAYVFYPGNLKPVADLEIANGVNRFFIQESSHQPTDDKKPGLGLMIYGQWFTRHETWAKQAKAWTDYLARSSYMMQQGRFVADILYYYGEDNNITGLFSHVHPDIPDGYDFDYINAEALTDLLSCRDRRLTVPSGMEYRVLAIDKNARKMSLPVLRKIALLAEQGVLICGQVPEVEPTLTGDSAEFARLVNAVWHSGRSNVYPHRSIAEVLEQNGILPDMTAYEGDGQLQEARQLRYVHRSTEDAEIYWLNNRTDTSRSLLVNFRVSGLKPQLWHPETGMAEEVSYTVGDKETSVRINLVANDAVFIVFSGEAPVGSSQSIPQKKETLFQRIRTPWKVAFADNMEIPKELSLPRLVSYTECEDKNIKYYSGTAVYRNHIRFSSADLKKGRFIMNLGKVGNVAEVIVNGQKMGTLWKSPYVVDITDALHVGDNSIEIPVTNLWVNRIIGDLQPDCEKRHTYTAFPFYTATSELLPSGLMGPVDILRVDVP